MYTAMPWRKATQLRTRRALLVIDCQNGFLSPDPSNPMRVPPASINRLVNNLKPLVSAFREAGDELVWVNTEFKEIRETQERDGIFSDDPIAAKKRGSMIKSDKDSDSEDLVKKVLEEDDEDESDVESSVRAALKAPITDEYLSERFVQKYPNFLTAEKDTDYPPSIKEMMSESDKKFTKNEYSAFQIDNFLSTLRSRMVTEIYFVGAHSNVGIFASIADAAMHGFVMTMVDDCVLYRGWKRHDLAVKEMETELGMKRMKMLDVLKKLGKGPNAALAGKQKTPEEEKGEEVAGTGRIRNPVLGPEVVELLMELKLKDSTGSPTGDAEPKAENKLTNGSAPNSNSSTNMVSANGAKVNGGGSSVKTSQRNSLTTPEQLINSGKLSERPKSAPVGALQLSSKDMQNDNSSESSKTASSNSNPTPRPSRPSPVQRPFSMDAIGQFEEEDDDALVEHLKRNVRQRTSGPPSVASTSRPSSAASMASSRSGAPQSRVRAKVTMRRPQDKKRPESPDKPGTGSATSKSAGDIARSMSGLSISTISSGEAEQAQQAKDELLKSIMGKKSEAQPATQMAKDSKVQVQADVPEKKPADSTPVAEAKTEESKPEAQKSITSEEVTAVKPTETKSMEKLTNLEENTSKAKPTKELKSEDTNVPSPSESTNTETTKPVGSIQKDGSEASSAKVKDPPLESSTNDSPDTLVPTPTYKSTSDPEPSIEKASTEQPSSQDVTTKDIPIVNKPSAQESSTMDTSTKNVVAQEPSSTEALPLSQDISTNMEEVSTSISEEAPATTHTSRKQKRRDVKTSKVLGPDDVLGEPSDSTSLVTDLLPPDFAAKAFAQLKAEIQWRVMYHRGGEVPRLVAVQGSIDPDGSFPIYRHPSDESPPLLPFSKGVEEIRKYVEKELKHPVNHVLIQLYRAGTDHISEHSDKTLDIVKGSSIVNVSLGAQRVMTLRTKKKEKKIEEEKKEPTAATEDTQSEKSATKPAPEERISQKIPLPHNSMFVLGLPTNQRWLHSINPDKRLAREKSTEELAYNGERISLTFRHIGTFLSKNEKKIWGQGAINKTKEKAGDTIVGEEKKAEEMVYAFAAENQMSESFDWDKWYGNGFDVLHFKQQRRRVRVLRGDVGALAVKIAMESIGWGDSIIEEIGWSQAKVMEAAGVSGGKGFPVLEDVDRDRTVVVGGEAILLYLATATEEGKGRLLPNLGKKRAEYARCLSGLMEVGRLRKAAEVLSAITGGVVLDHPLFEALQQELAYWDDWYQPRKEKISSEVDEQDDDEVKKPVNIVDCAVFPYMKKAKDAGFLEIRAADGKSAKYEALTNFMKKMEKDRWVKAALKTET